MDPTAEELEDLTTMRTLRQRLRAVAECKIAECETMPRAASFAELGRQMRTLIAADRMVIALYRPLPRRRSRANPAKTEPALENLLPCVSGGGAEQAQRVEAEGAASAAAIEMAALLADMRRMATNRQ